MRYDYEIIIIANKDTKNEKTSYFMYRGLTLPELYRNLMVVEKLITKDDEIKINIRGAN